MFEIKKQFPKYYRYNGRKISKTLSDNKISIINNYYKIYSIDELVINFYEKEQKSELKFNNKFKEVNLEVGFGDGEYLINSAISNPDILYIGSEVYINGLAKVLLKITEHKLKNLLICGLNFTYLMGSIKKKTINKLFIINPDPWKKKRHVKRRLINHHTIVEFSNLVSRTNSIFITTDSVNYLQHVRDVLNSNENLRENYKIKTLSNDDKLYRISRYQRKAIEMGKNIYLITL